MPEHIIVEIAGDFITLDNLLKYSGLVGSGGQAGQVITDGLVKINGRMAKEKRKKVYGGDTVSFSAFTVAVKVKEA